MPFIPIILGTARDNRHSVHPAKLIHKQLEGRDDLETDLIDVKDYLFEHTYPAWEEFEVTDEWREIAQKADGFLIVTPEYNHGYPGELKIMLDSAYKEYAHKPVALAGVSGGSFGGARVVDHLKPVLVEFKMNPLRDALYFPNVRDNFNEDGSLKEEKREETRERIADITDQLVVYARGMEDMREELMQ